MSGRTRITGRDREILSWIGRHGVVTPAQVGGRFFTQEGAVAQKRAYRRLAQLDEAGLLRRDAPFARHPEVIRLRAAGAEVAGIDVPPARYVIREIPHELAVVDLVEELLAANKGATFQTGREVRSDRMRARTDGKRLVGQGRTPDAVILLKSGKTAAVELSLVPKRQRDYQTVLKGYRQERFDAVWWYVPASAADRVRRMVKAERCDDFIDVRVGPGPETEHPELTSRDFDVLIWIGRYGLVTEPQVASRFFVRDDGTVGLRSAGSVLRKLEGQGLLVRTIPYARHPAVLRLTDAGADISDADIRPAGWVPSELAHSIAVVDLMESLLAEHPGSTVQTERELRIERGHKEKGMPRRGEGRVPDGELILKSDKRIAVELDLTPKRNPDIARIIRWYQNDNYAAVWWFVKAGAVDRMQMVVKENKAARLVEVHPWNA